MNRNNKLVILGVTESDSHVVANHLLAHLLRANGYQVLNLGACTPLQEFIRAYEQNPGALALLIGSLNGHGYQDLQGLAEAKKKGRIRCPVVLGGNLSVGSEKSEVDRDRYYDIGVDHILTGHTELLALLENVDLGRLVRRVS